MRPTDGVTFLFFLVRDSSASAVLAPYNIRGIKGITSHNSSLSLRRETRVLFFGSCLVP